MNTFKVILNLFNSYSSVLKERIDYLSTSDVSHFFDGSLGGNSKKLVDQIYYLTQVFKKTYMKLDRINRLSKSSSLEIGFSKSEVKVLLLQFDDLYKDFSGMLSNLLSVIADTDSKKCIYDIDAEDFIYHKKVFDTLSRFIDVDLFKKSVSLSYNKSKFISLQSFYKDVDSFKFDLTCPSEGMFRSLFFLLKRFSGRFCEYKKEDQGDLFLSDLQKSIDYASKFFDESMFLSGVGGLSFMTSVRHYLNEVLFPVFQSSEEDYFCFYDSVSDRELKLVQDIILSFKTLDKKYQKARSLSDSKGGGIIKPAVGMDSISSYSLQELEALSSDSRDLL